MEAKNLLKADVPTSHPSLKYTIRLVTPDLAARWLEQSDKVQAEDHPPNRGLRQVHVTWLAQQILDGKWVVTGDPIKFSPIGKLIDGQHRLQAVIEAGKAVYMAVCHGVPGASFEVIDTGRRRSASDTLHIAGYTNTLVLAAAAGLLRRFEVSPPGQLLARASMTPLTNEQIREIVRTHPGLEDACSAAQRVSRLMPQSMAAVLYYLFAAKDSVLADAFFEALSSGTALSATDPVWALREKLLEARMNQREKVKAVVTMALVIKAWNMLRTGKKTSKKGLNFKLSGSNAEHFPQVE